MESLAITSKVLYDKDLLDKKKEIAELKSEILENTIPKILYDDYEEWDKLKIEAIKICQEGVRNFISVEEYPFMRDFGFTPNQQMDGLYTILWKAFNKITKGQSNEWISNYAQIIAETIAHTIYSLIDMGLWENIYDSLGRDGLITFVLKILMKFFDDGSTEETLDSICVIRKFKCSEYDKLVGNEE